jgi:hypothetical protein
MLERWLSARDANALRSAWIALAPRRHELSHPDRTLTVHGAAQLAAAMLGERADWIVDLVRRPADVQVNRVTDACFVDDAWDVNGRCHETWELHEQRHGPVGVQVLIVGCGSVEGRPEGGSETVVRVFDRDRAASVRIGTNKVSTIGDIDLAPLDLYGFSQSFAITPTTSLLETLRGLIAQLAAELDAHYDTSPLWPSVGERKDEPTFGDGERTFGDGERSLTIRIDPRWYNKTSVTVHGLPWGHSLEVYIQTHDNRTNGYLYGRLPNADIDRILARLGAIANLH